MVEFLRKFESRGDKLLELNSHHQIYQFTLILYGIGIVVTEGDFPCTVHL